MAFRFHTRVNWGRNPHRTFASPPRWPRSACCCANRHIRGRPTTTYRVKEVTSKLESEVKATLGVKSQVLDASSSKGDKLSHEEKAEVVKHAQEAVNKIQVHELTNAMKVLATDVFNSPQPRYYITVDRLDEYWVDDALRYGS